MKKFRHCNSIVLFLILALFVGGPAWGQTAPATQNEAAGKHKPTLAVTVASDLAKDHRHENLEDLLAVELANQSFLQLVDRQTIHAVIKEHTISLNNLNDMKNALTLGKFAGADYLLHALTGEKTVAVRLVEVASSQVKLEEEVAWLDDPTMLAVAIREKVLTALHPQSQAVNRLTVGIAAFSNRSGTDRSDRLGIELQKFLRSRLEGKPWAVVLERQYPTALLVEVDLTRAELVRTNGVEKLPPADLVIFGSMKDANREYVPDQPWMVKLELTLQRHGQSHQIEETFRSDEVTAVADRVMEKIDAFRRQPVKTTTVAEKELWRRQALYLMPRQLETWRPNVLLPHFFWASETNNAEVIRAWENILLLDENDLEAMHYLGVFLISCNRWDIGYPVPDKQAAVARSIAGSQLVERALRKQPTPERAASYIFCIRPMIEIAPARAKEMAQYVYDHPQQFKGIPKFQWIKIAQTGPLAVAGDEHYAKLKHALDNAEQDPEAVLILFSPGMTRKGPLKQYRQLLDPYQDSSHPLVQFIVHRALGDLLCWQKKDPAALGHFDKAIAVMEVAYKRCKEGHRESLNDIYRHRIEACLHLGLIEEAKKTAWAGAEHFMENGRFGDFNNPIGWLYRYCVTEAFEEGQEKQALAVCDTYYAKAKKHLERYNDWVRISAKREELSAKLAGKPVPDMSGLQFISGTRWNDGYDLKEIRMAATEEKLWLVPAQYGHGPAMQCSHDGNKAVRFSNIPTVRSVAVIKDNVFFGDISGIYKFDTNGKLLKHYDLNDLTVSTQRARDICAGDGKIFFSFMGSPHSGVAMFDPSTEKISVLAPSGRDATPGKEPITFISRVRWDAVTPRLYACGYFGYSNNPPKLTRVYGWSPQEKVWQKYPTKKAPHFVVSNGDETLLVYNAKQQTEFQFVRSGQKVTATIPVPSLMGDPSWDEQRIWVPTSSGLYEVDRSSGQVTWLAYQDDNPFLSTLKHGNRLYIATGRGLYYRDLTSAAIPKSGSENRLVTLPVILYLESNAQAEVSVSLDQRKTLQKVLPGTVQLDLTSVGDGDHRLYFSSPDYVTRSLSIKVADGEVVAQKDTVALFRKRYVILRCAFNKNGDRKLDSNNVTEQRVALSHLTGVNPFRRDWMIWQKSNGNTQIYDTPYLEFHRYMKDFGFARPASGTSYENMKQAPESGYRCENIKAEKGLVLYCRVNGNMGGQGHGYGKVLVEEITETPPNNIPVLTWP